MDNYWFLYNLGDGSLHGLPYMGGATEWANIPEGCGVLGFVGNEVTYEVKQAYANCMNYKIENSKLVSVEYTSPTVTIEPTELEKQADLINSLILDNLNMQMQIDALITSSL